MIKWTVKESVTDREKSYVDTGEEWCGPMKTEQAERLSNAHNKQMERRLKPIDG